MENAEELNPEVAKFVAHNMIRAEIVAAGMRRLENDSWGPQLRLVLQVGEACGLRPGELDRLSGLSRPGTLQARRSWSPRRFDGCSVEDLRAFVVAIVASNQNLRPLDLVLREDLHLEDQIESRFLMELDLKGFENDGFLRVSDLAGRTLLTALPPATALLSERERRATWAEGPSSTFYFDVPESESQGIYLAAAEMMSTSEVALITPEGNPSQNGRYEIAFRVMGQMTLREARWKAEDCWLEVIESAGLKPRPGVLVWHDATKMAEPSLLETLAE